MWQQWGERIKQLRKENGMTQAALAEALGVTKGTVSTWETNSRTPSFEALNTMSDIFKRSFDYIMGRSDDAAPRIRSDEKLKALTLSQVEDDLTEYALKYARLDRYGCEAVEAIIRAEYNRCRSENTLATASAYFGNISVRRETTEG